MTARCQVRKQRLERRIFHLRLKKYHVIDKTLLFIERDDGAVSSHIFAVKARIAGLNIALRPLEFIKVSAFGQASGVGAVFLLRW